jgi:hypothetical protein
MFKIRRKVFVGIAFSCRIFNKSLFILMPKAAYFSLITV